MHGDHSEAHPHELEASEAGLLPGGGVVQPPLRDAGKGAVTAPEAANREKEEVIAKAMADKDEAVNTVDQRIQAVKDEADKKVVEAEATRNESVAVLDSVKNDAEAAKAKL